jgi:hypothetical protein
LDDLIDVDAHIGQLRQHLAGMPKVLSYREQSLAMVLVMLNLLAFLIHTVLDLCDEPAAGA